MSTVLSILQHSLGVDQYGRGSQYREHFVAGPGHSDYEMCLEATERGLMEHTENKHVVGGHVFFVTDSGRDYVAEHSPEPPKLTQSQKRYAAYLRADSDMSFGEWLRAL